MTDAAAAAIIALALLIWNGAIVGGTAYIVFGLGYSGWWWLLALLLMSASSGIDAKVTTKHRPTDQ